MFYTIYVLLIISTAPSAIAMPPSTSDVTNSNLGVFDYPNKDCEIIPLPGKYRCLEPENCHKAGGLCIPTKRRGRLECHQAVVDGEPLSGYQMKTWWSRTLPNRLRSNCAGCSCVRRNVRRWRRRAKVDIKDKLGATSAHQRDSPSTERSSSSVDENKALAPAMPQELQSLVRPEARQDSWMVPPVLQELPVSKPAVRQNLAELTAPRNSIVPINFADEERTSNREMPQESHHQAESENESHPPLMYNPAIINPDWVLINHLAEGAQR
jgi:hypothetical protein